MELKATRFQVVDRIGIVTLHRPHRRNAWTGRMHAEYRHVMARAEADPEVRVIVVTGAGDAFCVGADSQALDGHIEKGGYDSGLPDDPATPGYGVHAEWDHDLAWHWGLTKPVIAAINGACAGVGLALACWCDLRFAATGAKLTTAHGRLGLPPEFGLQWLLPRIVGVTRAADLLLSSRVVVGEEAASMGLVNDVMPGRELAGFVATYARRLAFEIAPSSIRASKRLLYEELMRSDPGAAVEASNRLLEEMVRTPEFAEGAAALREKRTPRY